MGFRILAYFEYWPLFKSSGLSFDTEDDALDFARQSVEHGLRWDLLLL